MSDLQILNLAFDYRFLVGKKTDIKTRSGDVKSQVPEGDGDR